jgi:hypothetical protein
MALKDWKRAKSGESELYPIVYRRKSDGDDVVRIHAGAIYVLEHSSSRFEKRIGWSHTKKHAITLLKDYMRRH